MNTSNHDEALRKATCRAADLLDLDEDEFASVIGVSARDVQKMYEGSLVIAVGTGVEQSCLMLIRTQQALRAIVGEDRNQHRQWLRSRNKGCGGVPLELMGTPTGLASVVRYLEGQLQKT